MVVYHVFHDSPLPRKKHSLKVINGNICVLCKQTDPAGSYGFNTACGEHGLAVNGKNGVAAVNGKLKSVRFAFINSSRLECVVSEIELVSLS